MLIVKSDMSLNSVAPDRVATEKAKDLPKLVAKQGWERVVLADERTMGGAVDFLREAKAAGLVASVGIQASRLRARGGTMGVVLVPLDGGAMRRLMGATRAVAHAATVAAVLDALPEVGGGMDMAALVLPGADYVPQEGEAEALRAAFRARGANLAVGLVTVGGQELLHAPMAECQAFAAGRLPVARFVAAMTKRPHDAELRDALVQFAEDCVAARRLPPRDRKPQGFDDASVPKASEVLAADDVAAENAKGILARVQPMTASRKPDLPRRLGLAPGESADDLLRAKARDGLEARIAKGKLQDPGAARERLEYELEVMIPKYSNYFLVMLEAVGFARSRGIPVGPGRGSAAGSMVTYAMGITNIDPLRHKLLFERFINPERVSLPDIDTDFCPHRRDEVLQHLVSLYGDAHVGQISTYGSMKPKGAVRKAATLLGMQPAGNRAVASMGKRDDEIALKFEQLHKHEDPEIAKVGGLARFLHGLTSNSGVHAGGVILSDDPIDAWAPLTAERTPDGLNVVSYDMNATEEAGFVKFDFLGVETLTIVDHCVRALAARGERVDLDDLPMDDEGVYEMLRKGRTLTVFQLEGGAITRAGREIGLTEFEDIVALVALYRPGPMGNIPLYASRKKGLAEVEYLHPCLEPVLEDTYGIIIYQEQIMQMARDFAGYTMAEADSLRRGIGKKKKAEVEAQREPFVRKAVEAGRDREKAEELFEFVLPFAQYGFNRSHAVAYSVLTYQTAWLKRRHAADWYASCLTFQEDAEKAARIVTEAATSGIGIVPPDVNASGRGYRHVPTKGGPTILMPLDAARGVGSQAAADVVAEREANGPFKGFADFARRVTSLNKAQVETLVWAGAFDSLSRHAPTVSRPNFAEAARNTTFGSAASRAASSDQMGLFAAAPADVAVDPPPRLPAIDPEVAANRQSEALENVLHHERRTIASSAWRRKVEDLQPIAKAAQMARTVECATMGILRGRKDRVVPMRDGSTRRVIYVTVEDEGGSRDFDVSTEFEMGSELVEARDRCVRLVLGPSQGFAFISGAPEVKRIEPFPDPLAEPREFPAVVLSEELDEPTRAALRKAIRDVAISNRAEAEARAAAARAAGKPVRAQPKRTRASHVLVVPPSKEMDVMVIAPGTDADDLRSAFDGVEQVASFLD